MCEKEWKVVSFTSLFLAAFIFGGCIHHFQLQLQKKKPCLEVSSTSSSTTENWGLGFYEEGKAPSGTVTSEQLKKYHGAYVNDTDEKVIYLTFDAGFENGNSAPILDALKKHHAKGTFFVVGNFLEHSPDIVKRMVKEGHTVANHTYHHPDMSKIATKEAFEKELLDVEIKFEEITGKKMAPFYRPPQGKYNKENLKMASELGYKTFFWSLAYVDWLENQQPSKEEAFEKLVPRIHPGAIVLLHLTSKTNANILDELLTTWEDLGYHFEPLETFAKML